MEVNRKGTEILLAHPGVALLADDAAAILNENEAENYVQFDLHPRIDRGKPWVRVTVQWANGISPAVKAARLARRVAELEQVVEDVRKNEQYWHDEAMGIMAEKEQARAWARVWKNAAKMAREKVQRFGYQMFLDS
jgi:hypothetical protein